MDSSYPLGKFFPFALCVWRSVVNFMRILDFKWLKDALLLLSFGYFQLDWVSTVERVALVSLIATVLESLPITGTMDSNISVSLLLQDTSQLKMDKKQLEI